MLGLLERYGPGSAYDLKRRAAEALGNFWSTAHSQLYRTTERLADQGLLDMTTESTPGGRGRIVYRLTRMGQEELAQWRAEEETELAELRDPGLLKLYFGADHRRLAPAQLEAHRRQLAAYERRKATDDGTGPRGPWLTLEAGIAHERVWVEYWDQLASSDS
ncbi:MAG: PadR family transcriptional regulator [Actinomycetota bacterium]|nr:PadR family transcriptional regulator [Actinomycetota bacterium]